MNRLSQSRNRTIIPNARLLRSRFGEKVRLTVGLGINLMGIGVLVAHSVRLLAV